MESLPEAECAKMNSQTPLLVEAALGKKTARPPVWLMRQAGRYLPEYRAIRESMDTLSMFRSPAVAAEITLQPLRRYRMDGAIVYADILLIPDALGLGLSFVAGEGPAFARPVRTAADVASLRSVWENDRAGVMARLQHVGETLELVKPKLNPAQALIGFAGAPWTVACYMIEGKGSHGEFFEAKRLAFSAPEVLKDLIDLVSDVTIEYLAMQIKAGAQLLQLFESWGMSLSAAAFREFCQEPVRRILASIPAHVPSIYFVNGVAALLRDAAQLGSNVLGVDWRVDLSRTCEELGTLARASSGTPANARSLPVVKALQGNLDPLVLYGSEARVRAEVRRIISQMAGQPFGHIFNLGHGLRPTTPLSGVEWCVDEVLRTH
jgi:uroporphyrinogen decarboxylase